MTATGKDTILAVLNRDDFTKHLFHDSKYKTTKEIAEAEGLSRSYVSDVLRLNLLSPEIINAIITGKQPRSLTLLSLMNKFPLSWEEQKVYFELN